MIAPGITSKFIAMKRKAFASIVALLLFIGGGCASASDSENDEVKVVTRIIARASRPSMAFRDQESARDVVSSLDTSENYIIAFLLDSQKNVFASYVKPDQLSQKEKFLAMVTNVIPGDKPETIIMGNNCVIAIVRVKAAGKDIGYVAVGRKRPLQRAKELCNIKVLASANPHLLRIGGKALGQR